MELGRRNTSGRCRSCFAKRLQPKATAIAAKPDPADRDAVNLWLRRLAIDALAAHAAAGPLAPTTYDVLRRSIQALHAEARDTEKPADAGATVLDAIEARLRKLI